MTWPWFGVVASPAAVTAPRPLSPAQIVSSTGQALLSEQSTDASLAWLAGGPLTNKNEHPDCSDSVTIIAMAKPGRFPSMTLLLDEIWFGTPGGLLARTAADWPAARAC